MLILLTVLGGILGILGGIGLLACMARFTDTSLVDA